MYSAGFLTQQLWVHGPYVECQQHRRYLGIVLRLENVELVAKGQGAGSVPIG